ncbi:hypothetical protein VCUG_02731, partial [Vavraia culicis subsp. floridensis]
MVFEAAQLSIGSSVTFDEGNEYISISQSKGLFNLQKCIGTKLCFEKDMSIKILPIKSSINNISTVKMHDIRFTEPVRLPSKCKRVELFCVSTSENAEIVLNSGCKELLISEYAVAINAQDVEKLDVLTVKLSITEENSIKFI